MKIALILLQPVVPRGHQLLRLRAVGLHQVQHAPRTAATGAALGVAGDRPLLIQEPDGLLQHRFRQTQLRMGGAEIVHQGRGIGISLQQTLQHPTHRQLQAEVLNGGAFKKSTDGAQARAALQMTGSH